MNKKYTEDGVIQALKNFKKNLGKEPTIQEIDKEPTLPTARQIQRMFGGVKQLRMKAGFDIDDHTKGTARQTTAAMTQKQCSKYEARLVNQLFIKHHDSQEFTKTVTRQFAYQQWLPNENCYINISSDVGITDRVKGHVTLVDFFYPQDMHSFGGCVRSKRKKLKDHPVSLYDCTHDVLFVCVNPDITQSQIDADGTKKEGVKVMSLDEFTKIWL